MKDLSFQRSINYLLLGVSRFSKSSISIRFSIFPFIFFKAQVAKPFLEYLTFVRNVPHYILKFKTFINNFSERGAGSGSVDGSTASAVAIVVRVA